MKFRYGVAAGFIGAVMTAAAPAPMHAQDPGEQVASVIESVIGAILLPEVVSEAREAGVADSTLTGLIEDFRGAGVPAADAESVLDQEMEVVRAGGPTDRFGAFVRAQVQAGLRGRDLAAAIRAEHRARGIGVPERRPDRLMRGPRRGGGRGRARPSNRDWRLSRSREPWARSGWSTGTERSGEQPMRTALALAVALVITGCGDAVERAEDLGGSVAELTVREIGNLASRILQDPATAEELLSASGLSVERLDSLMYEIASDPEMTASYLEGLGGDGAP